MGVCRFLTDCVALLFSVFSVTQQFVGASLPDTSGTIPHQQEDNDPPILWSLCFFGFFCVIPPAVSA